MKVHKIEYSVFNILTEEMDFNREIFEKDKLIYDIREFHSIKSFLQRIAGNREISDKNDAKPVTRFRDIFQLFYHTFSETYCDIYKRVNLKTVVKIYKK